MRQIAISIGHTGINEQPAEHPELGLNELKTSRRVRDILKAMLDEYRDVDAIYAPDTDGYDLAGRIQWLNDRHTVKTIDVAIEIHFNAFTDRTVDGCECLYLPTDATGQAWAEKLQTELVRELTARDRGAKAFDNEKRNGFLRLTDMPAVIIEPLFLTNDDRAQQVINGDAVQRIARAMFQALIT